MPICIVILWETLLWNAEMEKEPQGLSMGYFHGPEHRKGIVVLRHKPGPWKQNQNRWEVNATGSGNKGKGVYNY